MSETTREHVGKDGRSHFRVTGGNCACGWTIINEFEWKQHLHQEQALASTPLERIAAGLEEAERKDSDGAPIVSPMIRDAIAPPEAQAAPHFKFGTFEEWFDLWDCTKDSEIRRLCKITWGVARMRELGTREAVVGGERLLLQECESLLDRYREKARLLVIQTEGKYGGGEAIQFLVSDYDRLKARLAASAQEKQK